MAKKIWLVEDNRIQIDWAKKQLEGYDLRIFEDLASFQAGAEEAGETIMKEVILVVDLFLPCSKGKEPTCWWVKFHIPDEYFLKFKAVILVSNFEHHVRSEYDLANEIKTVIGQTFFRLYQKRWRNPPIFKVFFDHAQEAYDYVWDIGKKLPIKRELIVEKLRCTSELLRAIEREEFLFLKPYKRLVGEVEDI